LSARSIVSGTSIRSSCRGWGQAMCIDLFYLFCKLGQ
jgi:hypothetical protein